MKDRKFKKVEKASWVEIIQNLDYGLRVRVKLHEKDELVMMIDLYRIKKDGFYRMEVEFVSGRNANDVHINTRDLSDIQMWVRNTLANREAYYRIANRV